MNKSDKKTSEEYRLLKNRMKGEFRAVRDCLEGGSLPNAALLHTFINNSRKMTDYAGEEYGEADYPAYLESCAALGKACEAGDMAAARESLARVSGLKKSCHKQWKP